MLSTTVAQELGYDELQRFKSKSTGGVHIYREEYTGPTPKDKRPKSFRGYTKMRSQFVALCKAWQRDGRVEMIQNMVYPHQQKRSDCIACKPFMKTIISACKLGLKKKKKKKRRGQKAKKDEQAEEEPQEQRLYKQRVPSLSVNSLISDILIEIVEEPKLVDESYKAVQLLTDVLSKHSDKTPGEREYLKILVNYFKLPFEDLRLDQDKQQSKKGKDGVELDQGWIIQEDLAYEIDTST